MAKVETTTKKFREQGVRVSDSNVEIHWESTGHLSVRLTDEFGEVPLAERAVTVEIPKEGLVELVTDKDGKLFHPDVPFQEYELDLGDDVRVHATAVANKTEVQARHVPGIRFVYANIILFDEAGEALPDTAVQLEGPDGATSRMTTDSAGMIEDRTPRPEGKYKLTCAAGSAEIALASRINGISIVNLEGEKKK